MFLLLLFTHIKVSNKKVIEIESPTANLNKEAFMMALKVDFPSTIYF